MFNKTLFVLLCLMVSAFFLVSCVTEDHLLGVTVEICNDKLVKINKVGGMGQLYHEDKGEYVPTLKTDQQDFLLTGCFEGLDLETATAALRLDSDEECAGQLEALPQKDKLKMSVSGCSAAPTVEVPLFANTILIRDGDNELASDPFKLGHWDNELVYYID